MKKIRGLFIILLILLAGLYYYVAIPAVNIHSEGTWQFLIFGMMVLAAFLLFRLRPRTAADLKYEIRESRGIRVVLILLAVMLVVWIGGSLLSSPILNAGRYQRLLTVTDRDFSEDITEADYTKIPLLDKDSAALVGNRKMGSIIEYVSQFEVSDLYTQINYKDRPVRVTPLEYASTVKWFTNHAQGIPAYIRIDMTTQNAELVRLDSPIRYSQADHFGRNIYRHLRFRYPTYIFDRLSFEIDDDGTPFWICPVKHFSIGLFGGAVIGRVVLCNALTGETQDYAIDECPEWVDSVYSAQMLIGLYDYHGMLKNGYFNSILGQRDCLVTTDGYNYLALEDDVWVYTGVTSVSGDESNVGFVLMNQRTMETRYYSIPGAEEFSAMDSAQGQVQNLGYKATFPLLLNVAGEPTYFMALKDSAGLVKKYAMVNILRYQNVAIGDTVPACEKNYIALLRTNGIASKAESQDQVTGKIRKITQGVIDGNSHFYILLEGDEHIYDVSLADELSVVTLDVGDERTFGFVEDDGVRSVTEILSSS